MDHKAIDETLTLTETAQVLGVSRPFVKKLIERGELQAHQSVLDRRAKLVLLDDIRALQRRALSPFVQESRQAVLA